MKAENWFQLRIVGVTSIASDFGRASSIAERSRAGRFHLCLRACRSCEHGSCKCLRTQQGESLETCVHQPLLETPLGGLKEQSGKSAAAFSICLEQVKVIFRDVYCSTCFER